MRSYFWLLISFVLLFHFSCAKNEEIGPYTLEDIWIYGFSVPCHPSTSSSKNCFVISQVEPFDFFLKSFEKIPNDIVGFDFLPGHTYKLRILRSQNLYGTLVERRLVKVISQERDYFDLLVGNWKVKRFKTNLFPFEVKLEGRAIGFHEFPRMILTSDGCNQVGILIGKVGSDKILEFESLPRTLLPCAPQIAPTIGISKNFKREGNDLIFFDEFEGELMVLEKVN